MCPTPRLSNSLGLEFTPERWILTSFQGDEVTLKLPLENHTQRNTALGESLTGREVGIWEALTAELVTKGACNEKWSGGFGKGLGVYKSRDYQKGFWEGK